MGLDTSHDCWHGSYGAFNRWREKIAEIVGIPLSLMEGFYKVPWWKDDRKVKLGWEMDFQPWLPIKWESLKPDIIHKLLHHSDCDGELEWEICAELADRLESLLPEFPVGEGGGHIGNWRDKTSKFIDGLRLAAERQENVDFH